MHEIKKFRSRITVEADLGKKGVEKTDVYVYQDGKLIETHFEKTFDDIREISNEIRSLYTDSQVEVCCIGEDCAGGLHRWSIDDQEDMV
ncbi:hypothetical protein PITCH_A1020024 [uncultured Desulfobacterium sp.]|uniref:Uncharacterized protein n=1 Tax=uncultured Desulfobacterium sp. TaxID=201089 RepID=A0A445MQU3_9BACT|nr:hypothetical protein PITCH_A1020024 [uncultured Desulfobacterium sp.]